MERGQTQTCHLRRLTLKLRKEREDAKTSHILSAEHQAQQHKKRFLLFSNPRGGCEDEHPEQSRKQLPSAESGAAGPAGQRGRAWHPGTLRCRDTGVPSLLRIRWPKQKTKRNYMFLFHFPTPPPQLLLEQLQPNDNKMTFNTGED